MKLIAAFLLVGVFGRLFAGAPTADFAFVDDYLARWDKFAQGENEQVPYLRDHKKKFEAELSRLLHSGAKKAIGRVVFYAVVQVGGFIDIDSELGREASKVFGPLPLTDGQNGEKLIFAGDIYFWWESRKRDLPEFSLYTEWEKRDFAQNVAIQMYKSVREQQRKKG
jgi:hypothetical protein